MPKPVNRLAVLKPALEQVTASRVRSQKAKKNIDKINDEEIIKSINTILKMQLVLENSLRVLLHKEQEKAKSPVTLVYRG